MNATFQQNLRQILPKKRLMPRSTSSDNHFKIWRQAVRPLLVRPFSGGSSLHVPYFLKKGYGVTVVLNEDNSCGLRCLVLAMCPDVKRRNLLKAARASQFTQEVEALALSIGQSIQDPMDFTDFDKKFIYMYPQYEVVFLSK